VQLRFKWKFLLDDNEVEMKSDEEQEEEEAMEENSDAESSAEERGEDEKRDEEEIFGSASDMSDESDWEEFL